MIIHAMLCLALISTAACKSSEKEDNTAALQSNIANKKLTCVSTSTKKEFLTADVSGPFDVENFKFTDKDLTDKQKTPLGDQSKKIRGARLDPDFPNMRIDIVDMYKGNYVYNLSTQGSPAIILPADLSNEGLKTSTYKSGNNALVFTDYEAEGSARKGAPTLTKTHIVYDLTCTSNF